MVQNLKKSTEMAGLLFSPHPDMGGWQTTRAVAPELVAFTNKEANPQFYRLAVEFFEAGIADENGWIPRDDEYRVVAHDLGYEYGEQLVYQTAEDALEKVVLIMVEVTENRE